jgi:hypothetical protein
MKFVFALVCLEHDSGGSQIPFRSAHTCSVGLLPHGLCTMYALRKQRRQRYTLAAAMACWSLDDNTSELTKVLTPTVLCYCVTTLLTYRPHSSS